MYSSEAVALREKLSDAPVLVKPERRGFNTRKGVPDAVVWVGPDIDGGLLCAPVLFELESVGGFHAAKRDVSEFAARADDEDHRYHLIWPTAASLPTDTSTVDVEYNVQAVPSATVTGEYSASEKSFYDAVVSWSNRHLPCTQTSVRLRRYGSMEVVWWTSRTRAFGFELTIDIPVLASVGEGMTPHEMMALIGRRVTPSLTMFAVIDGRPKQHEYTTTHATTVQLKQLPRRQVPLLPSHSK